MHLGVWFVLLFSSSFALAEVVNKYPDTEFLAGDMAIIDIRTQAEWQDTGVVAGALPITFFDERGQYDARAFLASLEEQVNRDEPVAIICRSGNRTQAISRFLSDQGYQVVNLEGGMLSLLEQGYQPVAFEQRVAELNAAGDCSPGPLGC